MQLTYSDEQEEFRGVLRRFLDEESPTAAVRARMESDCGFDPAVWRRLAEDLGIPGLHLAEEYGGQGFSSIEQGVVLQEMGRALLCAPYFGSIVLAAGAVMNAATPEQKREILPALASGETLGALAVCERDGIWGGDGISLTAESSGGVHCLDGEKTYVVDGHSADLLIVVGRRPRTRGDEGLSFFALRGDAPGVERHLLPTMDATRKLARVTFRGARAELIGEEGDGASALTRTLDLAAVALANEMIGGAEKVLEMTVEYAKTRVQFGRPIGSFQAIKHKCADMLVDVELAKSAAIYAAATAAEVSDELSEVAATAKALVADAYHRVAAESIQVHGGIGFTWEHDCHLYFKRARSSALLLGDSQQQRERMLACMGV